MTNVCVLLIFSSNCFMIVCWIPWKQRCSLLLLQCDTVVDHRFKFMVTTLFTFLRYINGHLTIFMLTKFAHFTNLRVSFEEAGVIASFLLTKTQQLVLRSSLLMHKMRYAWEIHFLKLLVKKNKQKTKYSLLCKQTSLHSHASVL